MFVSSTGGYEVGTWSTRRHLAVVGGGGAAVLWPTSQLSAEKWRTARTSSARVGPLGRDHRDGARRHHRRGRRRDRERGERPARPRRRRVRRDLFGRRPRARSGVRGAGWMRDG